MIVVALLVVGDDGIALHVERALLAARPDAAAVAHAGVAADGAAADGERAVVADAGAAMHGGGVASDAAVGEGQRSALFIVDAAAVARGVVADAAAVDGERAPVIDGAAVARGLAGRDGAALQRDRASRANPDAAARIGIAAGDSSPSPRGGGVLDGHVGSTADNQDVSVAICRSRIPSAQRVSVQVDADGHWSINDHSAGERNVAA